MNLCVVTALFNHVDVAQIIANYERFAEQFDCDLYVVELLLGSEKPVVPDSFQLRGSLTNCVLWQKENLLNILINRLPPDVDAVAWIDADILMQPNWLELTKRALAREPVVQLFDTVQRLGYNSEVTETLRSAGINIKGHPGYAWAARRDFLDKIGGLFPYDIFGGADSRMRWAFAKRIPPKARLQFSRGMWECWSKWSMTVMKSIKRQFICLPGTIRHLPHGTQRSRKYSLRMRASLRFNYDPTVDLQQLPSGLFVTTGHNLEMEDWLRSWLIGYHAEQS